MSGADDSQERTEEATPKRKQETKEKGQAVRSRELNTFLLFILIASFVIIFSDGLLNSFAMLIKNGISIHDYSVHTDAKIVERLHFTMSKALKNLSVFFACTIVIAIAAPTLIGGFSFNLASITPKMSKLDPLNGIKKMFSFKSIIELIKSILKFLIIVSALVSVFFIYHKRIISLSHIEIFFAIESGISILEYSFLIMISFMIIVVAFDIPMQLMEYEKQTMMTKQEIKDEYKQTEGKPEVKSKIRQMQKKIAKNRMMSKVPKANVVITNPTHYAVALQYDQATMASPIVVAKGADYIAKQIMEIAKKSDVPLLSLPALARSIYHTTELEDPIPSGLYVAVAQVLAYLYQLELYQRGKGMKPKDLKEVIIPEELKH